MSLTYLLTLIILCVFTGNILLTKWLKNFVRQKRIYDVPIVRSSHTKITPRGGGLGFVLISLLTLLLLLTFSNISESANQEGFTLLAALTGISLLGWFDDIGSLPKRIRFSVQIICSLTILFGVGTLMTFYIPLLINTYVGIVGTILGVIWIAGTTNIYNFMDGIDGIASLQGIVAAFSWAILGWISGVDLLMIMNLALMATLLAFLLYNWSPASIFMGDVGSVFLGFWFASLPFWAASFSPDLMVGETIWFAAFVIWPFLFDGSFTIARRFKNGENILEAHRSHLYQRLNIAGYSHKHIATLYVSFAIISSVFAFLFLHGPETLRFICIAVLFILSIVYALYVRKIEERNSQTVQD